MPADLAPIWSDIEDELRRAVPERTYDMWLGQLEPRELDGMTLVVAAPDTRRDWIAGRFARVLQTCAAAVVGARRTRDRVGADEAVERQAERRVEGRAAAAGPATGFNPKYTFEQFVIGDGNRLAHGAALAVAELPAQAYNPLFIYGPPGVGKTHLLHSIGNYVEAYGGGMTVRYSTAEAFTNDFVAALQSGAVERFKDAYRSADVLLVDDVQFLQSKARTEEEFFHTFNALYETGSQLVLSCDRLPRDMQALEDRLLERFEAGLVTDIRPPDFATRMTILRKRVAHDELDVDEGALEVVAERVSGNVRALEGALIRVVAFASLTGSAIGEALAAEVLGEVHPEARSGPRSIREIQLATCEAFDLTLEELLSPSRAVRVAWPRQVAMYLARDLTDRTLPAIGDAFGGRSHTTVMHAVQRAVQRIGDDSDAYETVQALADKLQMSTPPAQ